MKIAYENKDMLCAKEQQWTQQVLSCINEYMDYKQVNNLPVKIIFIIRSAMNLYMTRQKYRTFLY